MLELPFPEKTSHRWKINLSSNVNCFVAQIRIALPLSTPQLGTPDHQQNIRVAHAYYRAAMRMKIGVKRTDTRT